MVFPVVMYGCESWTVTKAEPWGLILLNCGVREDSFEGPLNCKEIQPVHPKGDQSWVFIGRSDIEAETPILWLPDAKNQVIGKDPDAGKDWRQEKGMTEDETVGWHHLRDGHEWANSGHWWWTRRPGVLQSMEPQNVGHDCMLKWTELSVDEEIEVHWAYFLLHNWKHIYIYYMVLNITGIDHLVYLGTIYTKLICLE